MFKCKLCYLVKSEGCLSCPLTFKEIIKWQTKAYLLKLNLVIYRFKDKLRKE